MNAARISILVLVAGGLLLLVTPALARVEGATSIRQAHRTTRHAYKTYREALRVEQGTRLYTGRYGANVGRWTRLARRVGWPWGCLPNLMYIIDRESGGSPTARNPSSASGLLQLMSIHWAGKFDPFNPRKNLAYGLKLYRSSGWQPWAL